MARITNKKKKKKQTNKQTNNRIRLNSTLE